MIDKIFQNLKKIKLRTIILLVLILAFNTYAWFIYATKVSTGLEVSVSSWNVEFLTEEGETVTNVVIDLERIYPGMENFERSIEVNNQGDTKAILDYEIKSLKVLGTTYVVSEETGITQEYILERIAEYPFKIEIQKEDENLALGTGPGIFRILVQWPFESGNDELDTLWGNRAYEYYALNPGEKSIELNINLIATQKED